PGNNGGDGLALARILKDLHFEQISVFCLHISNNLSADAAFNHERLLSNKNVPVHYVSAPENFPLLSPPTVIVDALFGSGLSRPLEGLAASLVNHINQLACRVIAIDIPSGLPGDEDSAKYGQSIIKASDTLTFEFPKLSFFFSENEIYTGHWHILPIGLHPQIIAEKETAYHYALTEDILPILQRRNKFAHKGNFGHALLIAGSYGMMGAAILSARACLRTGTGLLTTHLPALGYPIAQVSVPESIFSIDGHDAFLSALPLLEKYTAIGIGPGIGTHADSALALNALLHSWKKPLVVDADAINLLATNSNLMGHLPENTILTPHPGEFDRLTGKNTNGYQRHKTQLAFSVKYKVIIVLKGAYTSVTLPNGHCFFNSTGNPGMATAGCGDVLTGMILSLLAQGYTPREAAVLGVFLHGLAGDIACSTSGEAALIASDVIDNIGNAYKALLKNEKPTV
ncbi:MAG: NAD(P)H-hydrate dehydratase, partial [Bacteroidales bacterium]|nr:NAD(P)H-hydrate dehydratase [Bacteroidales bacterium]